MPLIVLLQGPVGPFFRQLAGDLADRGLEVIKINFTGGDLFFSGRASTVNFRGSPSEWALWFDAFVKKRQPLAAGVKRFFVDSTKDEKGTLDEKQLAIHRSYVGNYFTSLEMAGATVTMMRLTPELAACIDAEAESMGLKQFGINP